MKHECEGLEKENEEGDPIEIDYDSEDATLSIDSADPYFSSLINIIFCPFCGEKLR